MSSSLGWCGMDQVRLCLTPQSAQHHTSLPLHTPQSILPRTSSPTNQTVPLSSSCLLGFGIVFVCIVLQCIVSYRSIQLDPCDLLLDTAFFSVCIICDLIGWIESPVEGIDSATLRRALELLTDEAV